VLKVGGEGAILVVVTLEAVDVELEIALVHVVLSYDVHLPKNLSHRTVGLAVVVEEADGRAVVVADGTGALCVEQGVDPVEVDVGHVAIDDVGVAHDGEVVAIALSILCGELTGNLEISHIDVRVVVVARVPFDGHVVTVVAVATATTIAQADVSIAHELTVGVDVAVHRTEVETASGHHDGEQEGEEDGVQDGLVHDILTPPEGDGGGWCVLVEIYDSLRSYSIGKSGVRDCKVRPFLCFRSAMSYSQTSIIDQRLGVAARFRTERRLRRS